MRPAVLAILCSGLALGACGSTKGGGKDLPSYVDAADRSESCAEAVSNLIVRRAREAGEAQDPQAMSFARARLEKMGEEPPTPENTLCYVAHVEADGDLTLNGIYTSDAHVNKTLRLAKYNPDVAYTYFRITNPPGAFSRSVVFKLSERLKDLNIQGGLMTKFDTGIRGEDKLDPGSRALGTAR